MSVCAWGLLGGGVGSSKHRDGETRDCGREWVCALTYVWTACNWVQGADIDRWTWFGLKGHRVVRCQFTVGYTVQLNVLRTTVLALMMWDCVRSSLFTVTVWPSPFTRVPLNEMFSVTGVRYETRSHLLFLILFECAKMECLTVKTM